MTRHDLDMLAAKIAENLTARPRWLKLKAAALYSSIGQKRLKSLADDGEIIGYPDPDSKRGDWIFDRESIDEYRLAPAKESNMKLQKILDGI